MLPSEDADGKPFKQPYYIYPADGMLSFAGLYELWGRPGQGPRPVAVVGRDHHPPRHLAGRGDERPHLGHPPPDRIDAWLDPNLTDKDEAQKLISGIDYEPPPQVRAVSTAVNMTGRGASKGPELIRPLADQADQPLQLIPA